MNKGKSRGAAAVEFALVAPLLIAILLGIVDFGRAMYMQSSLYGAARSAVRVMALTNDPTRAKNAALANAAGVPGLTSAMITVTGTCATGSTGDATVRISYPDRLFVGTTVTINTKAVMRCAG